MEWISTLDAAEFAGPASEGLCSVSNSLAGRKRRVPFAEDVILAISPGAFADKRDCVSTDLTDIRQFAVLMWSGLSSVTIPYTTP